MALTDESSGIPATMLVGPTGMTGGSGCGFGNGGDGWWIILLILLLAGNNGFGNNGGGFGGGSTGGLYPWMNQAGLTSEGFQNQLMNDNITSIRDGVHDLSTQLCNCCSDVQMSLANGFSGVEQSANARQMANMQQAFAAQTTMSQGFNALGTQFADCCCEQRLASAQTQNIIQNEGNSTRFADANNTRDIITSQTAGFQRILDQLCQDKIDAKNERIADLERQLTMANLNASQVAQTARLERSNADVIDGLYDRLSNCPVPSMPVYGKQPIFTCGCNNSTSTCGCGGNF